MTRRDMLKVLLGTAAASYVDYEKLLWIPGEKTIFIPPVAPSIELIDWGHRVTPHNINELFQTVEEFYLINFGHGPWKVSKRSLRIPPTWATIYPIRSSDD